MKTIISSAIIGLLITGSGTALAGHKYKHGYSYDYDRHAYFAKAKVVDVEPIYTTVRVSVPHEECYTEEVRRPVYHRHSDGAAVVGGIIGGILGNKIGHGEKGATIAGTLVGAAIAKNANRHRDYYEEQVSYEDRCLTRVSYRTEERIDGYHVTYKYKGEEFTTRMDEHPGKYVRIRVRVSPVVD